MEKYLEDPRKKISKEILEAFLKQSMDDVHSKSVEDFTEQYRMEWSNNRCSYADQELNQSPQQCFAAAFWRDVFTEIKPASELCELSVL